jgi:hypothetical protein
MENNNKIKKLYELAGDNPVYCKKKDGTNLGELVSDVNGVSLSCLIFIPNYEDVGVSIWEENYNDDGDVYLGDVPSKPIGLRDALSRLCKIYPYTLPIPFSAWGIE